MAKTKQEKNNLYSSYSDKLDSCQTVVLLDTHGIKTSVIEEFKSNLGIDDSRYFLLKNTIFLKALKDVRGDIDIKKLEGSSAGIFSQSDPSSVLKHISKFLNENKSVSVKFGILENVLYDESQVIEISKLPSKTEMVSKVIADLKNPAYSFIIVMSAVPRNFIYVLNAIRESKSIKEGNM